MCEGRHERGEARRYHPIGDVTTEMNRSTLTMCSVTIGWRDRHRVMGGKACENAESIYEKFAKINLTNGGSGVEPEPSFDRFAAVAKNDSRSACRTADGVLVRLSLDVAMLVTGESGTASMSGRLRCPTVDVPITTTGGGCLSSSLTVRVRS